MRQRRTAFSNPHVKAHVTDHYRAPSPNTASRAAQGPPGTIGPNWLHQQYILSRRTLPDIAAELGISTAYMTRRAWPSCPVASRRPGGARRGRPSGPKAAST